MSGKITLPCLCANVRRASRVLSQIYDDAMRPLGLRMTQASILQALSHTGETLQGDLADLLGLDSTTLTRSVGILRKRGWIKARKGHDRRERWLSLSRSGIAEYARIQPAWNAVQEQVRSKLGEESWRQLVRLSTEVANLPVTPA
ncbi:MAG TPA: MarR family winged helix-turn-helix transcriptional regulator [Acidobacteriaceae bacterium]|jgi:DNA-binding MarR family transcriptional regulator|nr:MarR family winged helix-turn-helix transcriptional regulator [Acidobacteriaceae bacterium]